MRRLTGVTLALVLTACASAGDPPGGPPDTSPPKIVAITPDSNSIDSIPPKAVDIRFDEVISERVAAQKPEIGNAIILSPDSVPPSVDWHRDHITIVPKHGFQPNRIYRVELLPVITDLRTNRMRRGMVLTFSTGPAIPSATLTGTVVDWPGAHAATGGLVEAMLMPDSLPYRALADSAGNFRMEQMPPGEYLVYGIIDQNSDRRKSPREAFDTARVRLADSASAELFTFVHDTAGPRLRRVESVDSMTLRLTFTAPLDPGTPLDTHQVHIAPAADSTNIQGVAAVVTQKGLDSLKAAEQAARAAERAARDTTRRVPADTVRRLPHPDSIRQNAQPDTGRQRAGALRDSTRAQKMIARRPAPLDTRYVRLLTPTTPAARYIVWVDSARSISLFYGDSTQAGGGRQGFSVPRPPPTRADSLRRRRVVDLPADTARADTTHPPLPSDTTRRDGTAADTTRPRRDTSLARPTPPARP